MRLKCFATVHGLELLPAGQCLPSHGQAHLAAQIDRTGTTFFDGWGRFCAEIAMVLDLEGAVPSAIIPDSAGLTLQPPARWTRLR